MMVAIWVGGSAIQSYYYYNNRESQEQQENQKYLEFLQSSYDSCLENYFIFNNRAYDEIHHQQCLKQVSFLVKETWKKGTLTFNAPSDGVSFTLEKPDYQDERTIIRNEITFAHRSKINIITEEKVTPRAEKYICNSFFSACDTPNLEKAYKENKLSHYLQNIAWQRSRFVIFFGLFLFLIFKYFRSSHKTWKENYIEAQEEKERYQKQVSRIRSSSQSLRLQSMALERKLKDENIKMSQLVQGLEAAKRYIDQKDQEILTLTHDNTKRIERLEQLIEKSEQEKYLLLENKQKQEQNLQNSQQQLLLLTDSSRQSQEMKALLRLKEALEQQNIQLERAKIKEKAKAQQEINRINAQKAQLEQSTSLDKQKLAQLEAEIEQQKEQARKAVHTEQVKAQQEINRINAQKAQLEQRTVLDKQQLAQLEAEIEQQKEQARQAIGEEQAKASSLRTQYEILLAESSVVARQNLQKIQKLEQEIKEGKASLQELYGRVEQLEVEKANATKGLDDARSEQKLLNEKIEQLNQDKRDLVIKQKEFAEENNKLNQKIKQTKQQLKSTQQKLSEKETELATMRKNAAANMDKDSLKEWEQKEQYWKESEQFYDEEIKKYDEEIKKLEKKNNELENEKSNLQDEIFTLQQKIANSKLDLDRKELVNAFLTKFKLKKSNSQFSLNSGKHHSKDFVGKVYDLLKSFEELNLADKVTSTPYRPTTLATLSVEKSNVDKRYYLVITGNDGAGYSAAILLTAKDGAEAVIQAQIIRMLVKDWNQWKLNIKF